MRRGRDDTGESRCLGDMTECFNRSVANHIVLCGRSSNLQQSFGGALEAQFPDCFGGGAATPPVVSRQQGTQYRGKCAFRHRGFFEMLEHVNDLTANTPVL